jgi:hypothetical protein
MTSALPDTSCAVVVQMRKGRHVPFARKVVLVIREGRVRLLRDEGQAVLDLPIAETSVSLTPGGIVRLEGRDQTLWLLPLGEVGASASVPRKLRNLVEAEGAIAGPIAPPTRGARGALDIGGATRLGRGSEILLEVLVESGARRA